MLLQLLCETYQLTETPLKLQGALNFIYAYFFLLKIFVVFHTVTDE